jgi:hypothetical protein
MSRKIKISSLNRSYNMNKYVRESHNCYSFFLNLKSKKAIDTCKQDLPNEDYCRRSQPGYASGYARLKKEDFSCPIIMKRTLDDNKYIYRVKKQDICPADYYKGALVVAPHRDYHYYRQNDDTRYWDHKPGYKPVQHVDSNNNIITDPQLAARDYGGTLHYTDFCGYLCVPRDPEKKKMTMFPNPALAPMKKRLTKEIKTIIHTRRKKQRQTKSNKINQNNSNHLN